MSVVVSGQRIHGNYDGIICFGAEDWWYHNRGHNDIRFMRELAKEMPVLFINSLGLRIPKLKRDTNTLGRIKRKLKSIARGRVHVENDFYVISPTLIPGKFGFTYCEICNEKGVQRLLKRRPRPKPKNR